MTFTRIIYLTAYFVNDRGICKFFFKNWRWLYFSMPWTSPGTSVMVAKGWVRGHSFIKYHLGWGQRFYKLKPKFITRVHLKCLSCGACWLRSSQALLCPLTASSRPALLTHYCWYPSWSSSELTYFSRSWERQQLRKKSGHSVIDHLSGAIHCARLNLLMWGEARVGLQDSLPRSPP